MKRVSSFALAACLPLLCQAATPWQQWGNTFIRLEDDGNVACVSRDNGKTCDWSGYANKPTASSKSLVCGAAHRAVYGISGYDRPNHWCTNAYGDLFANWRRGDYFGYSIFLAKDPEGHLMCASNNSKDCDWYSSLLASGPEKPVKPLTCGEAAEQQWGSDTQLPGNWCHAAPYTIEEVDFADPKWATERFNYAAGWAGTGFGLSGTQRGAPESISIGVQDGRKGLAILSQERTDAWRQSLFNGTATGLYAKADVEPQDDFFMYSRSPWIAADKPAVVMHVYLPKGSTTSLRMPVTYQRAGVSLNRWPGIWINPTGLALRTVKGDFQLASLVSSSAAGAWWTLGLKVTAQGDMEYYAVPEWKVSPFESAYFRGRQSGLLGDNSYKIISQSDASVMVSSVIRTKTPVVIGDIRYAKTGSLSMDAAEK